MRRILCTLGVLCIWIGVASAEQTVVMMPEDNYRAIMEKLDTMQKKVDSFEEQKGAVSAAAPADDMGMGAGQAGDISQDISTIYDTLDVLETKSLLDRLNLSIELRTRMNNWKVEKFWRTPEMIGYMTALTWLNDSGSAAAQALAANYADFTTLSTGYYVPAGYPMPILRTETNDNNWVNRFRINMDADISKGLKFTGRLAVFKNWASTSGSAMPDNSSRAHAPGDSTVMLDRAYVDWIPDIPIPLAITFGRQPSTEGLGSEIKENRKRQSTYPALVFDGESEGIVTTLGLERYTGLKNSGLRLFYAKGFQSNDQYNYFLDNYRMDVPDTPVAGLFFETEIPKLPKSYLVMSYVRGNEFPDMFENKVELGDMDLFALHMQANDLMDSGLDVFFSYAMNVTHPNGNIYSMTAMNPQTGELIYAADGSILTVPMGGFMTSTPGDTESQDGWALYTGLAYTIPVDSLKRPKIGFEYNHGSQYWFSYTWGSVETYNKLATRGDVYDFYYIQPFNRYLYLRTGYTMVDYSYSGSGMHLGKPMEVESTLRNFYFLLDCRF